MEIQIPHSILFTFLCFVVFIRKLISVKYPKNLPPGPRKLPLIGNLHQIGSLPHRSLRDLANKYGPIMHLQLGQMSHVIISSPDLAKEIMKTHDIIFSNRPKIFSGEALCYNSTDIAFSPYGNYWRQLRKICTLELLSVKRVQTFRKIREEEVSAFVKHVSEHELGSVMNLTQKLYPLTNSIIARAAFGRKTGNVEGALAGMMYTVELVSGLSICDLYPSLEFLRVINGTRAKADKAHRDLDRMLSNIINDHLEKKDGHKQDGEAEEDLVDVLLRIQKEHDLEIPLTFDNIKAILQDMFIGGTETTATTTEWAMAEMIRSPEVMKKAQEEVRRIYGNKGYVDQSELHRLKYVDSVIRETLRLHPPVSLLGPRENSEACRINGYDIPAKTVVNVNAWAINRHPDYWNEPEKFQPERFINNTVDYKSTNFELIPFGGGRRICPGVSFATPILELIISNLLYHFDWKLPNGEKHEELDMSESFGAVVKRKNDLCLVPMAYRRP
ncbi:cytochrome P450 71D10-like [Prosopis cineraria]|uniref:cytochrome P450 71D10-like n=1 Tax=Prosopis cineraria TaxID=364024 RepID=UPI0024103E82|nr:cytochrome P450 71D10-like [Prosopis cineraria]XP_054816322.1 cytochrome P450 71D10-like [Prosopis cineraria]